MERVRGTSASIRDGVRQSVTTRTEVGAFLRVLRGGGWRTASTTDLSTIGPQLARLASESIGAGGGDPREHLAPHVVDEHPFADARVDQVPLADKLDLLESRFPLLDRPLVRTWSANYLDEHREKVFVSSAGAEVSTSFQRSGLSYGFTLGDGHTTFTEKWQDGADRFGALTRDNDAMEALLERAERFLVDSKPVQPGEASVVLSPEVAGVFAHESFGHKSEADFMLGDPTMLESWQLGMRIGEPLLSIVDDGTLPGTGFTPWDDEGQPAQKTWLIRDGVLAGRLHSATTAAALGESTTGNARALSFRFDPIVRMTSTYISPGTSTREALFAGVEDGVFVETFRHGSGMSTFTIAPGLAWRIRDGRLAEPVRTSVISGSVFETLGLIDGVSDGLHLMPTVTGGCGKFEQYPLPVAFGGPYVRIKRMTVA